MNWRRWGSESAHYQCVFSAPRNPGKDLRVSQVGTGQMPQISNCAYNDGSDLFVNAPCRDDEGLVEESKAKWANSFERIGVLFEVRTMCAAVRTQIGLIFKLDQ
jgi:hypothetical protein